MTGGPDMQEPLLDRIRVLEKSVERWRRVSIALLLLLLCFMAISGTFGAIIAFNVGNGERVMVLRAREQAARAEAEAREAARQHAEQERLRALQKAAQDEPD